MRYELRLHRFPLSVMITLLILFVIVLFYLNARPGGEHLETVVSLLVVIIVATVFAYMGTVEGIIAFYFGIKHGREFIAYFLLGLLSIFSGLYRHVGAQNEKTLNGHRCSGGMHVDEHANTAGSK